MKLTPGKPLPTQWLYRPCDSESLNFESTAELKELKELPGQDRAIEAIHFGTEIGVDGHNVYVLGRPGSGRHDFVRQFLEKKAAEKEIPRDWYLDLSSCNFEYSSLENDFMGHFLWYTSLESTDLEPRETRLACSTLRTFFRFVKITLGDV